MSGFKSNYNVNTQAKWSHVEKMALKNLVEQNQLVNEEFMNISSERRALQKKLAEGTSTEQLILFVQEMHQRNHDLRNEIYSEGIPSARMEGSNKRSRQDRWNDIVSSKARVAPTSAAELKSFWQNASCFSDNIPNSWKSMTDHLNTLSYTTEFIRGEIKKTALENECGLKELAFKKEMEDELAEENRIFCDLLSQKMELKKKREMEEEEDRWLQNMRRALTNFKEEMKKREGEKLHNRSSVFK